MKKVTKFFMAALLAGICSFGYGQDYEEAKREPKPNERVLGTVAYTSYDDTRDLTGLQRLRLLLNKAKKDYPDYSDRLYIREFEDNTQSLRYDGQFNHRNIYLQGKVVYVLSKDEKCPDALLQAFNKAMRNVREGSRMAIDQVTVISGMDRETMKDHLLDVLLDKGYKVVAKEYLEKLYEEQQNQQSGIYNENTTVKENNFSAVGYYINVKVTETSLRVQVVNVSTGEYEGNATVNF